MYLLIKYIKSVLWRVAKCLSYIEEAQCLKVNVGLRNNTVEDCARGQCLVFSDSIAVFFFLF